MKRIIIIFIFLFVNCFNLFAQDEVYYVILTSQQRTGDYIVEDGIYRSRLAQPSAVQKSPSIFFTAASPNRKIEEIFRHADYDIEKLKVERSRHGGAPSVSPEEIMDIKVVPISFLETIDPIDLDKEFPTMTYESARDRLEPLRGKRIYVIDRNDITEDTVKLIGVKYITSIWRRTSIETLYL